MTSDGHSGGFGVQRPRKENDPWTDCVSRGHGWFWHLLAVSPQLVDSGHVGAHKNVGGPGSKSVS